MAAIPVTDDRWSAAVLDACEAVVVAFHAPTSSPCRAFGPIVDELAADLRGRATVLALDVEKNVRTAQRYEVSALPSLLVFRGGVLHGRMVGARTKARLVAELQPYLG